jgi:hypothetical protein
MAAMHTANPACCKHLDACTVSDDHRGGYSGCAIFAARNRHCQITPAAFSYTSGWPLAKLLDLGGREADNNFAFEHCDGSRHCAAFTYGAFHCQRCFHVNGIGQTMRNQGGFEGNNWAPGLLRRGYFGCKLKVGMHVHDSAENDM